MKKIFISFFTIILFFSCKNEPQHLVIIKGKQLPITEEITSSKAIETVIEPFKKKVKKEMNVVLSFAPKDLNRHDGKLESSLGNLMADLCQEKANLVFNTKTGKNIDFAMFNFGGIRAGISKGEITTRNAFQLMPFENNLVVVELSSEKIIELVNYLINEKRAHPLSKDITLVITKNGYDLRIKNSPIENSKTYFVLTSDYLQKGGDNMKFFNNPISLFKTDYKVRNAIIDYLKENDTIKVKLDGRFRSEI
ncbi:MAG: 5'-nucleotidase C-terminal domain-containing protein [Lutibacter sp.]|nr:5'-nucleotidase C-terminal domain-containing protein [Lutibacter sp.]